MLLKDIKNKVFSGNLSFEGSEQLLKKELKEDDSNALLYLYLGELYYQWGEVETPPSNPVTYFERALELAPNNEECLFSIGTYFRDVLCNYSRAKELLTKLVCLYPSSKNIEELLETNELIDEENKHNAALKRK